MLINLHVKNLALIEEAEIEFEKGLNVLTGETGAGKSLLLGAVNLALGSKKNTDMIGRFADYALCDLTFLVDDEKKELLSKLDVTMDDNTVIVSRKITADRNIIKLNGQSVTLSFVRSITGLLIDIHGQHDHQSLLYPERHISILDNFAKEEISESLKALSTEFSEYKALCRECESYNLPLEERTRNTEFLIYETEKIREAAIKEGEDEELEKKYRKYNNYKSIFDQLSNVNELLGDNGYDSAASKISQAQKSMIKAASCDSDLEQIHSMLCDAENILNDFNSALSEYMSEFSFDEEDFDYTEKRLNLINSLKAKYGGSLSGINAYLAEAEEKLEFYADYEKRFSDCVEKRDRALERVIFLCNNITKIRKNEAEKLKKLIIPAIKDLGFLHVDFDIKFEKKNEPSETGIDNVEFMVSLNPGEPLRPLAKAASGGELSRIMLGLKSVLASKDDIDTLIFDEIDTGISGRTAGMVAEKMNEIGKKHQVICITHLPQIAAMADAGFMIDKSIFEGRSRTSIVRLDENGILKELSRMLGGLCENESVMANAVSLRKEALNKK